MVSRTICTRKKRLIYSILEKHLDHGQSRPIQSAMNTTAAQQYPRHGLIATPCDFGSLDSLDTRETSQRLGTSPAHCKPGLPTLEAPPSLIEERLMVHSSCTETSRSMLRCLIWVLALSEPQIASDLLIRN